MFIISHERIAENIDRAWLPKLSKWENTCNFRQEMVDAETKKALSGIPLLKTKVTIR